MKMLDVVLTVVLVFSGVSTRPPVLQNLHRTKRSRCLEPFRTQHSQHNLYKGESRSPAEHHHTKHLLAGQLNMAALERDSEMMDFLHRLKRSPQKRRGSHSSAGRAGRRGPGGGCVLRQVQVKVSDLGLGYRSQEEFVFRYCSGICLNSLTNYDKVLSSLAARDRKVLQGSPPTACCRPVAYDDDLSFLDDNLLYHTVKKHSARRCGCV